MDDVEFIKHQQLWIRPLLARAFSSAALSGVADWKNYLFNYFSGGLTPSYICAVDAKARISGVLDTATVSLHFAIRHSCSQEAKEISVQLDDLHHDLGSWVSDSAKVHLQNQTQRFLDHIVDFMKAYNLTSSNLKLSPFDQHAWDQMIWQHWTKKQQDFIVVDTDDTSSPMTNVDEHTMLSSTRGNMLAYFPSRDDQAALLNILTCKTLTAPLSEKDDMMEATYKEKYEQILRKLDERRVSAANLPSRPFRSDVTVLGAVPHQLSAYKDNALSNIMKHFGPKKPAKPITFTKWGIAKHEPVKSRNDSRYAKSRARKEVTKKAMAPIYVNGEKIEDFGTYAGGDPSALSSTSTLDFDVPPVRRNQARKIKPESAKETQKKHENEPEVVPESTNQAKNIKEQLSESIVRLVEQDIQRVRREEGEQYPGSEAEDDAELLDDFGDSSSAVPGDESNLPWSTSYSPDASKKGKDTKKPRAKTPLPEVPVKRLEPRKMSRRAQEIAKDIGSGFNALTFMSFAFLKCAAWMSKSAIWQSVHALLSPGVKHEFTDGQWTLRGVPKVPRCVPRIVLPVLDQCYDANGNPLLLRKVCLVQPEATSFSSWFSIGLRHTIAQVIDNLPYASEPFGGQEARTEWIESGKCSPRVTSLTDLLSSIAKVFNNAQQSFSFGLFLDTNQCFKRDPSANGTYKMEKHPAMSSDDLSAFYETLLTEFPNIEFMVDAFADYDKCGDHCLHRLEETGHCQLFRTRKVNNGMPGNRSIILNPGMQVSKLVEDVIYARSAGQKTMFDGGAGVHWADNMNYQIALGIQANFFIAEGCSTNDHLSSLEQISVFQTSSIETLS